MKSVVLFVILISFLECAAEDPSVYVRVSWDMTWPRFCPFVPLFAEKLSKELYETKVLVPYKVKRSRIRFMNADDQCKDKGSDQDAIVDLFVSKSEKNPKDVDRNITILAYIKLRDYWKNQKMALLDAVFVGQVNKVELMGKDKPNISEGMSESTRVAIGIVVGLAIAFLIASISLFVNLKRKIKKPLHGVPITSVPLHVMHTEPSIPTMRTDEPPPYNLDQQDGYQKWKEDYNGYDVRNHGNMAYDDGYEQQEEDYDGYAVRNHGRMTYDDRYERRDDSYYNGYVGRNHGNMAYGDEPLGSPML